ncbi:MAG: DUF4886 domain-containing protein [Oscillospiraceae bacterium]|nr:DUF4886 domain-containing protein [Oscillospiraceae bacterium]
MKRILSVMLILAMLLGTLPFAASAAKLIGDVNEDAAVNAKDVTILRRYIAEGYGVTIDARAGDTNADGSVSAKDVTTLRRYLAGGYGVELGTITYRAEYTDAVTGGRLYEDLGKPAFGEYSLTVLVDGEKDDAASEAFKEKIVADNAEELAPVGSRTEATADPEEKTVTLSISKYYAAQIAAVHPAEEGKQAYITLKAFDGNAVPAGEIEPAEGMKVANAFITNEFTAEDVGTFVVYTKAGELVETLERAEAKIGKITEGGVTPTALALDGKSYKVAATAEDFSAEVGAAVGICLDPNGNVLCSEKVNIGTVDGNIVIDDYAIFLAAAKADKKKGDPRTMPVEVPETIKLLVIGNSFGNDSSLAYLASELKSVGAQNVTVGTLYYSGCPYKKHLDFGLNNKGVYDYYENGSTVLADKATLDYALAAQDWTHIMLLSGWTGHPRDFGIADTDPLLWQDLMLCYVRSRCPEAYYGYDMCWVVRDDIPRAESDEKAYQECWNGDQMTMYNGIVGTVKKFVETDERFKFIAPVGTAIQNARSSFLGDGGLYRDSLSHLNKGIGRYISTLTVCCTLTGCSPEEITYIPSGLMTNLSKEFSDISGMQDLLVKLARESVTNTLAKPYEITPSSFTDGSFPWQGPNELPIN